MLQSKLVTLGAIALALGAVLVIWKWFPGNTDAMALVGLLGVPIAGALKGLLTPSDPPKPPEAKP